MAQRSRNSNFNSQTFLIFLKQQVVDNSSKTKDLFSILIFQGNS